MIQYDRRIIQHRVNELNVKARITPVKNSFNVGKNLSSVARLFGVLTLFIIMILIILQ